MTQPTKQEQRVAAKSLPGMEEYRRHWSFAAMTSWQAETAKDLEQDGWTFSHLADDGAVLIRLDETGAPIPGTNNVRIIARR